MKIAAAQLKPVAGDTSANINRHLAFIELAAKNSANLVYFPELSISGYEPTMANTLVMDISDTALDVFQESSNTFDIIIGIGVPLSSNGQVHIGMVWFQPSKRRCSYAKQLLHADELPYFISGDEQLILQAGGFKLAPAICYESLQESHVDKAVSLGATVYLASVAKSEEGIPKAMQYYATTAKKHNIFIILVNCIGPSGDFVSAGQSAAWSPTGELLSQMKNDSEGILIIDTDNNSAILKLSE